MKRHLRTVFGLSVAAAALTAFGALVAAEATVRIARKLWPTDDSTFVVDGWDVGAA